MFEEIFTPCHHYKERLEAEDILRGVRRLFKRGVTFVTTPRRHPLFLKIIITETAN